MDMKYLQRLACDTNLFLGTFVCMIFFLRSTRFWAWLNVRRTFSRWSCAWNFECKYAQKSTMGSWYAGRIFCFKITHQPPSKIKWSSLNITCGVTDRYHPVSLMLKILTTHKRLPKQQYINISWMEFKLVFAYHIWPFVLFILKYNKKSIFHFTNGICQFRSPEWALGECRATFKEEKVVRYTQLYNPNSVVVLFCFCYILMTKL